MTRKQLVVALAVAMLFAAGFAVEAQMKKPEMVTLSGKVIDITCAAKGKVMMDSWGNAENDDHMTPNGKNAACATMCLKGGQPAGLFQGDQVAAVFACNPRETLSNFAAQDVEVQGFWAGGASDGAKSFVPAKIRAAGGSWEDVNCATMHG